MLSKVNYYLDWPVKFFFVSSKARRVAQTQRITPVLDLKKLLADSLEGLRSVKDIYQYQIKRYMGLGFLSSFIPGTEAFKARIDYVSELNEIHKKSMRLLEAKEFYESGLHDVFMTPFYFLGNFFIRDYQITTNALKNIQVIRKPSIAALLSYLPLVSDVIVYSDKKGIRFRAAWFKNLMYSLLNPAKIASHTLRFLHRSIDRIFEIGVSQGTEASFFRQFLKGLSALIFLPLRYAVGMVESVVETGLNLLEAIFIDPLVFIYESTRQAYETWQKEFVYLSQEEYQGAKKVRLAIKHVDNMAKDKAIEPAQKTLKLNDDIFDALDEDGSKSIKLATKNYRLKITTSEKAEKLLSYANFFTIYKDKAFFSKEIQKETIAELYSLQKVFQINS